MKVGSRLRPLIGSFFVAKAWSDGNLALKDAIEQSGMSSSTFFRNCKKYGISKSSS